MLLPLFWKLQAHFHVLCFTIHLGLRNKEHRKFPNHVLLVGGFAGTSWWLYTQSTIATKVVTPFDASWSPLDYKEPNEETDHSESIMATQLFKYRNNQITYILHLHGAEIERLFFAGTACSTQVLCQGMLTSCIPLADHLTLTNTAFHANYQQMHMS